MPANIPLFLNLMMKLSVPVIIMDNDTINKDSTTQEVIGANNFVCYVENLGALDDVVARDTTPNGTYTIQNR